MLAHFQDRMSVFIILRYEENGTLLDRINLQLFPIDCAQGIATEIVLGLQALHRQNIVHGDLKPENILVDRNMRVHVADFGLALKVNPKYEFVDKWGTAEYQSPEQLHGKIAWDHRVDYFNVGVILLMMVTGNHPFGNEKREIQRNVVKLHYKMPQLPDDARSFIRHTLCFRDQRLNCISILKHPFVQTKIERVLCSYVPEGPLLLLNDVTERFYDKRNFFPSLPGVPFESEENVVASNVSSFDISLILNLVSILRLLFELKSLTLQISI